MNPHRPSERAVGGTQTKVWSWPEDAPPHSGTDTVAREEPLEIRVRGQSVAVTMRTPGQDEELAAGFLYTEGLIRNRDDVTGISFCRQGEATDHTNTLNVFLNAAVEFDLERVTRHFYASSSCGLCGKATLYAVTARHPPLAPSPPLVSFAALHRAHAALAAAQTTFHATGGLHAAALFNAAGNLLSGRVSFEIMQKALAARLPLVAAVSAPTSLAVDFARTSGQTLVGFLRPCRANLYAGDLATDAASP